MSVLFVMVSEGETLGEARGLATALLLTFRAHGIRLDAEGERICLDCRDASLLKRWLKKALMAESADDVVAEIEALA